MKIVNANRSYHLATRQQQGDIDIALRNVGIIREYADEILRDGDIKGWAEIQETLAWIYIRSEQPSLVETGKKIISDIRANSYVDQKFKDEISQNYERLGITIT